LLQITRSGHRAVSCVQQKPNAPAACFSSDEKTQTVFSKEGVSGEPAVDTQGRSPNPGRGGEHGVRIIIHHDQNLNAAYGKE
jgi:hypothetical protein